MAKKNNTRKLSFEISNDSIEALPQLIAAYDDITAAFGEELREASLSSTRAELAGALGIPVSTLYHLLVRHGVVVKGQATAERQAKAEAAKIEEKKVAKKSVKKVVKAEKSEPNVSTKAGRRALNKAS